MLEILFNKDSFLLVLGIVVVVVLLYILLKTKNNVVLLFLFCFALTIGGVYAGITCYTYYNTVNSVVGTPTIHDPYEDFNFYEYDLSNIEWEAQDEGGYKFEITYATSVKFEGGENKYQLLINNTPCSKTNSTNGRLHGEYVKRFKDLDDELIDTLTFNIDFAFYASNINLTVTVDATKDSIGLVREYVNVNGFNLRIISTVYAAIV